MWVLEAKEGSLIGKLIYITLEKPTLTIGRHNADLCLTSDSSISRKHCSLNYVDKKSCPTTVSTPSGLILTDNASKYGSFVKGTDGAWAKIEPNKSVFLNHGVTIRIGILQHTFEVKYQPIIVTASQLPGATKGELRRKLSVIGGSFINTCDNRVDYLVVESITLTVKVLQAMILGKPIVLPSFIDELLTSVRENTSFPDPRRYQPLVAEAAVRATTVVLEPGHKRDQLFTGLHFYVAVQELIASFKPVVELAGGKISMLDYDNLDVLLNDGAVMLEAAGPTLSQATGSLQVSEAKSGIREFLEKHGRRAVPDREVACAIAYASVSQMCNPKITGPSVQMGEKVSRPFSQCTILEGDTQPGAQINPAQYPVRILNCSQSEVESQVSFAKSETIGEKSKGGISGMTTTLLSRKRSLDISEEEPTPKRSASYQSVRSSQHVLVPESIIEEPVPQSRQIIEDSQPPSEVSSIDMYSARAHRSEVARADPVDNVFGKRKAKPERVVENLPKRSKIQEIEKAENKQISTDRNHISNPTPSTSKASTEFLADSRPTSKNAPCVETSTNLNKTVATDSEGWIDLSDRKDDRSMGEALGNTILLLSLVTLAQTRSEVSAPNRTTRSGLTNVKVFHKQHYTEVSKEETVELENKDFENNFSRIHDDE